MHIHIHDGISIGQIKQIFNDFYPFLKLEFFREPHARFELSSELSRIPDHITIRNIHKNTKHDGTIEIHPTQTVGNLEKRFQTDFDLPVQVYWIQKGKWVQTDSMDAFTLKEVNELSKNDSDEFLIEDYEEGFEDV
ncbi:MAG: hypothetical protein ACK4HE_05370 [Chitinophagaceae bacterium]